MSKNRKARKGKQNVSLAVVKRRPRVNLMNVLYIVIAAAVILSLAAGVFGGIAAPTAVDPAGTSAAQSAGRDTGARTPITVTPVPSTPVPTP